MKAFFAGRPYQLFNIINLVYSNKFEADLYIENSYANAQADFENVKKINLFKNVYFVKNVSFRENPHIFKELFLVVRRALFKNNFINSSVQESDFNIKNKSYDQLFMTSAGSFVLPMINYFDKAEVMLFEDGLGSYAGGDFQHNLSWKHKLYCMIFRAGTLNIKIKSLYVYNKKMCKTMLTNNILSMPKIIVNDKKLFDIYKNVFKYTENSIYYENKVIVLSQRKVGMENKTFDILNITKNIFEEIGILDKSCFRIHPAEKEEDYYGEKYINSKDMWEIICWQQITDNHVLISINSSALCSPFNIFKKQPYVIFLYKIAEMDIFNNIFNETIDIFRKQYLQPNKVFIPESIEEFKNILYFIEENNK